VRVRILEAARADLRGAVRYYNAQRPGLGTQFRREFSAAAARIKSLPLAWQPLSERTRRLRLARFPFGVVYQMREDEILIVAVSDLRQRPVSWEE
jgi:plasmid stabilization system protein ParE